MSADGPAVTLLADAAPTRGIGHAVRAATLALALEKQGARVEVVGRGLSLIREIEPEFKSLNFRDFAESRGLQLLAMDIMQKKPDVVITDGYFYPAGFYRALEQNSLSYGIIEDNSESEAERPLFVINQNPNASSVDYKQRFPHGRHFLGLDFAIVRPSAQISYPSGALSKDSVFVLIGGSDPKQLSIPLARRLGTDKVETRIAIGPAVRDRERTIKELQAIPGVRLPAQAHVTEAMLSSRVCVLAGGTSLWEANYMEKLVVGLTVADNQVGPLQAAKEAGIVDSVVDGRIDDPIEVADAVGRIVNNLARSKNLRVARRVDGLGADRLALAILDVMAH